MRWNEWRIGLMALITILAFGLSGCGPSTSTYPTTNRGYGPNNPAPDPNAERETIFGENGISLFGGGGGGEGAGIGVNSFLWRASLDTLSFMPLSSADPFGGVIITDWYSNPNAPAERFKITVYIVDKRLRADGVKVAVFRQESRDGQWVDTVSNPETATQLENAILTRARQLRIAHIETDQ